MERIFLIVFSLYITLSSAESPSLLLSTAIRINKIIVSYPNGVISERDLNVCQENSACNIIHKRFWLPPLIERLCRCPQRNECQWNWSSKENSQTIYLNNRSQLKFCNELSSLTNCSTKKPALAISTLISSYENEKFLKAPTTLKNNEKKKRQSEHRNVTISCNCQEPHYWKLKTNVTRQDEDNFYSQKTYLCSKLKKCTRLEFCGYVRIDTHSTFYRCSCPKGHLCMTKNKTTFQTEEILYQGKSYKAFCLPHKELLHRNT